MNFYYDGKKYTLPSPFKDLTSVRSFEYFLKKEYKFLPEIPYDIHIDGKLVRRVDDFEIIKKNAKIITCSPRNVFNLDIDDPWMFFTQKGIDFLNEIYEAYSLEPIMEKIIMSEPKKILDEHDIRFFETYLWGYEMSAKFIVQMILELAFDINEIYFEEDEKNSFILTKENKQPVLFITADLSMNAQDAIGENFNLIRLFEESFSENQYFWGLVATENDWIFTCYLPKEATEIKKYYVSFPITFSTNDPLDEEMLSEIIQILRFIYKTDQMRNFHDLFNDFVF